MRTEYDAVVVGGALSGSRVAELIAKQKRNVLLLEEHQKIGLPCKCTGLVSWRTPEILGGLPKKLIVNKLEYGRFFSPDGRSFILRSKKPAYVLDRPGLDAFLFKRAVKAGAEAKIERFQSFDHVNNHIEVKTSKGTYTTKLLIGADGANSPVAQNAHLEQPKNIYIGVQRTIPGNFDQFAELWFGRRIAPDFFAWLVPENEDIARIGVGASISTKRYYENFLLKRLGKNGFKPDVAGVMRFGIMKDTAANNIMLVGDAACQVKPYSGGGITYGLIASQICADAAGRAFDENRFDYKFLKRNYDDEWKKKLAWGIRKGMMLRKVFEMMSDNQINLSFKAIKSFGHIFLTKVDFDLLSG